MRTDELSMHQERNPTTVSQSLTQIQDLQNRVNSLSDAKDFYDPESGRTSAATHVPDQTSHPVFKGINALNRGVLK